MAAVLERPACAFCDNEALYAVTYYDWYYGDDCGCEIIWEEPYCISCAIESGKSLADSDVSIIDPSDSWWDNYETRSEYRARIEQSRVA